MSNLDIAKAQVAAFAEAAANAKNWDDFKSAVAAAQRAADDQAAGHNDRAKKAEATKRVTELEAALAKAKADAGEDA